ncbi:hypothetical protein BGZ47_009524 [Haplosporangium gracile]|nr:hypothetical protein BGZ47_009524 [Haplosporangium gracile]
MTCPAGYIFSTTEPRKAPFAAISETLEPGQRFQYWDYDIMWTEKHLPASRLEPLRMIGDVLADNALEALQVKTGEDALKALREYTARPKSEQESLAPGLLMKQLMTVPEWVDWDQVKRGQEVYWRYCFFISHALLHFSLAGGFAIPKITKVLNSTGYLSGKRTKERVLETAQFILDVAHSLEHLQPGTGKGWESIIQVRFLHAGVRARLSKISRAHSKYYNIEEHGVPINQEDLLATLFSFSNTMWRVMDERMGVHMTSKEREDYLHLWRYIGYMMGVDDILGATRTPERADACLESIVMHLADPDAESGRMCSTLLTNMARKPVIPIQIIRAIGLPDPVKVHFAMAEHLLGPEFWKVNQLPTMTRPYKVFKHLFFYVLFADLWLVNKLPWWFRIRSPLIREGQYRMIAKEIGRKRTQFELVEEPKDGGKGFDGQEREVAAHDAIGYRAEVNGGPGQGGHGWTKALTVASAALGVAMILAN